MLYPVLLCVAYPQHPTVVPITTNLDALLCRVYNYPVITSMLPSLADVESVNSWLEANFPETNNTTTRKGTLEQSVHPLLTAAFQKIRLV